tara:strand:- start:65505 stop:66125 length:621 start_codon:yes stop_codon:yes gene_type:complete
MKKYSILLTWIIPLTLLLLLLTCNGCRGGRSLGKGSAGTVILPQTPQEINKLNQAKLKPSKPVDIPMPERKPVKHESPPAEPTDVKSEPKAVGKIAPFKPTINTNAIPVLESKLQPKTSLISPPQKSGEILESNNEQIIIPQKEDMKVDWSGLIVFYLMCVFGLLTLWMLYDLAVKYFKGKKELDNQKRDVKVKKSAPKRKTRKRV